MPQTNLILDSPDPLLHHTLLYKSKKIMFFAKGGSRPKIRQGLDEEEDVGISLWNSEPSKG
jgi:hypothetical protein